MAYMIINWVKTFGGFGRILSLVIFYPLSVGRIKLAADVGPEGNRQYRSLRDIIEEIMKVDGFKGFYTGLTISFIGLAVHKALEN